MFGDQLVLRDVDDQLFELEVLEVDLLVGVEVVDELGQGAPTFSAEALSGTLLMMMPSNILCSRILVLMVSITLLLMAFFSSMKCTMMLSTEYLFGAMMMMPSSILYF